MIKTNKIASKIGLIRSQLREKELQQMKSSLRFNLQLNLHNNKEQEYGCEQLSSEKLVKILENEDIEMLYQVVNDVTMEEEDVLLQEAVRIVNFITGRLHMPICVMILSQLASKFELFRGLALEQGCFQNLINNMVKLAQGSQAQIVYLWTLCGITSTPRLIDKKQVQPLGTVLSALLSESLDKKEENNVLISLLRNCSQAKMDLCDEILLNLTQYFWKIQSKMARTNIYLICINLIENRLIFSSTKALVYALVVCLRGRKVLDRSLEAVLPSEVSLMTQCLSHYNHMKHEWSQEFETEVAEKTIKMGIHSFLMTLQQKFFVKDHFTTEDYTFFTQFWQKAPIEPNINKWIKLGTLDTIIESLPQNQNTALHAMQLLFLIATKISQDQNSTEIFQRLKFQVRIVQSLEMASCTYERSQLLQLNERLIYLFQGGSKQMI